MGGDEFAVVMDVGALARDAHQLAAELVKVSKAPLELEGQHSQIGFSHRRRGGSKRWQHRRGAFEKRRSRPLCRQERASQQLPVLRARHGQGDARAARARIRSGPGPRARRIRAELPAHPQSRRRRNFRASRRYSAGAAVATSSSPPPSSSPSPRKPASSSRSANGCCVRPSKRHRAGRPSFCVAINVSSVQFQRGNIVATVLNALGSAGLAPERVEIEITEFGVL